MTHSEMVTKFWWKWPLACGLGTLWGAFVAQVSAISLSFLIGGVHSGTSGVQGAFMLATAVVEGVIIGTAQWVALRDRVRRGWIVHTAVGVTLGWIGGMVGSLFEPSQPPSTEVVLLLAAVLGFLLGSVVGLVQMRVASVRRWWLWSALGWSCCLVIRAIAADLIPYGPDTVSSIAIACSGALLGGLAFGVITLGPARALRDRMTA